MKCNNCGQNEARFFNRSIINGRITELHLCIECAEKLGAVQRLNAPKMFDEFFGSLGVTASPFGEREPFAAFTTRTAEAAVAAPAPAVPIVEVDEDMRRQREINMLREQMKAAAESEDFEKAMSLREEINRLEM